jgi:hypothetical protein
MYPSWKSVTNNNLWLKNAVFRDVVLRSLLEIHLQREVSRSSEKVVSLYRAIWGRTPEDSTLRSHLKCRSRHIIINCGLHAPCPCVWIRRCSNPCALNPRPTRFCPVLFWRHAVLNNYKVLGDGRRDLSNAEKFKYTPINTEDVGGWFSHSTAAETGSISYPKHSVNF